MHDGDYWLGCDHEQRKVHVKFKISYWLETDHSSIRFDDKNKRSAVEYEYSESELVSMYRDIKSYSSSSFMNYLKILLTAANTAIQSDPVSIILPRVPKAKASYLPQFL